MKESDKLRGVIDYRAHNKRTKRNNAPIPRTDELFDRVGVAKVFSKSDLKTGSQISLKPQEIEKKDFNSWYGQFEHLVMAMDHLMHERNFKLYESKYSMTVWTNLS